MSIRKARVEDLPVMREIIADGKRKMRASGNLHQWEGEYPSDDVLKGDISKGFSYILEHDARPVATFVLAECVEPTYAVIEGGHWMDDTHPYATIHRIASREGVHGVLGEVLCFAFSRIGNIRIDTHHDNAPMRHLLEKYGFTYCGIIHLASGEERLAYQKMITEQPS